VFGVSVLVSLAGLSAWAQVSADDFLPPAQAQSEAERVALRAVKEGGGVQTQVDPATEMPAVTAGSLQDAINAAAQGINGTGHALAIHGGSRAWIAKGMGIYSTMDNPTATRISKRQAYVKAFMEAKSALAAALGGLNNNAKSVIRDELSTVNDATGSLHISKTASDESLSQAAECMLRGFVVYDVSDDPAQHVVTVTIVTTPRTRGRYNRPNPDSIEAASVAEGINAALAEVSSGVVPLTGGKIILVPSTGEMAFVGYGSAVVEMDNNSALQAKLNLSAEKSARARAMDALCGIIIGEQVTSSYDESQMTAEYQQSGDASLDPLAANPGTPDTELREDQLRSFRSSFKQTNEYQSVRNGKIPPGVTVKTWTNDAHEFAFGAAVYLASASRMAGQDREEMQEDSIVDQDQAAQTPGTSRKPQGSGFTDEENSSVPHPGQEVNPGPTGQVQDGSVL